MKKIYFNSLFCAFIEDGDYSEIGVERKKFTFSRYILWSFHPKIQLIEIFYMLLFNIFNCVYMYPTY